MDISQISTRSYLTTDYPQMKSLLEGAKLFYGAIDSEPHLTYVIEKDPESIIVALRKERIIGTVSISDARIPLIFRLAVAEDERGKGLGTQLMNEAEARLKLRGHTEIGILVDDNDPELKEFYERQGYEQGNSYRWMSKELE